MLDAKNRAIRSVDMERVLMYWKIGKVILEEEQDGKERAKYGEFTIKSLSNELQPKFGSGFSVRQLERYRQFYRIFPNTSALRTQFSWTHYRLRATLVQLSQEELEEESIQKLKTTLPVKDITPAPKNKISLPLKIIITIVVFLLSGILVISAMKNNNLSLGYHSGWEFQVFFIITTLLICWHLPADIKSWPVKKKLIFGVAFFFLYMLLMFGSIALLIYISIKTE